MKRNRVEQMNRDRAANSIKSIIFHVNVFDGNPYSLITIGEHFGRAFQIVETVPSMQQIHRINGTVRNILTKKMKF